MGQGNSNNLNSFIEKELNKLQNQEEVEIDEQFIKVNGYYSILINQLHLLTILNSTEIKR